MGTDNAGIGGVGGALPPPDAGGAALPAPTPADAVQHVAPSAPSAPTVPAQHAPQTLQPPSADAMHAHPTAEHAASGPTHAPPHGPQTSHTGGQPTEAMHDAHAPDASHAGGQHAHETLQAPHQRVGSKERGVRRFLRSRPRMFLAAGSAVAVVTAGIVVVATRDDGGRAACTAERSSTALTDPDWPLPTNGNIVNDQSCSIASLAGYWDGDWGKIVLRIDDDGTVVAAYEHDTGLLVGTVTDGVLRGKWCEAPSYAGDFDAGLVEMRAIAIDGVTSIDGRWIFGSDPSAGWFDNWDVTGKTGESPPQELVARLDTAKETCVGPS